MASVIVERELDKEIAAFLPSSKAIIIQGARQVGKTTLLKSLLEHRERVLWVNGDSLEDREAWNEITQQRLELYMEGYQYLVIDEAQRINNVGLATKLIIDSDLDVQVFLSGSSSLDLASNIKEPLTGRKWTFELYPLSWRELKKHYGAYDALRMLNQRLVLGSYPEVVTETKRTQLRLREIVDSYLYKDILEFGDVRKPELIVQLLKALAYQVGSDVSYNELANSLRVSRDVIQRYIGLLEDSYVLFRLAPLSTNPRKEITKSRKIYFLDNGIRNALINDLTPLSERNDQGALWENYLVTEFLKIIRYRKQGEQLYYWRNKNGTEIDLVVQKDSTYFAYEFKYNPKKRGRFSREFMERYQPKKTETVNRDNFYQILEGLANG